MQAPYSDLHSAVRALGKGQAQQQPVWNSRTSICRSTGRTERAGGRLSAAAASLEVRPSVRRRTGWTVQFLSSAIFELFFYPTPFELIGFISTQGM